MKELIVENIHLAYDKNPVLKGVSMSLEKGEVVSLLGASGSGKTTLLRAVAGLEQPSAGRINIGNQVLYDSSQRVELPAEQRNLGLVFQSYALWPHMRVWENVAYPLTLRKESKPDIQKKVHAILDQLGLKGLGERYPSQLSGGQQQRVAIARALVYNPPVILLDEPLSNLDAKLREEARVFLRELIVSLGLSALMVTHDQGEAMAISDRILLLNGGSIEQEGTPQDIYSQPGSLYAAEFMGSNNRLTGEVKEVKGELVQLQGSGWSLWGRSNESMQVGQQATAIVRVEQVQLTPEATHDSISLPLLTSMYLGDKWEYVFRMQDQSDSNLRAFGNTALPQGHYHLYLPTENTWIYQQKM